MTTTFLGFLMNRQSREEFVAPVAAEDLTTAKMELAVAYPESRYILQTVYSRSEIEYVLAGIERWPGLPSKVQPPLTTDLTKVTASTGGLPPLPGQVTAAKVERVESNTQALPSWMQSFVQQQQAQPQQVKATVIQPAAAPAAKPNMQAMLSAMSQRNSTNVAAAPQPLQQQPQSLIERLKAARGENFAKPAATPVQMIQETAKTGSVIDILKAMRISQLKLSHFRNIASLNLDIPESANLIALIGQNGSGKTSVLEAISLLTPTRGMLTSDGKSQIEHGHKEWGLWAQLHSGAELGQIYRKSERILHIDGHREPLEATARHGSVVWLTPATDFLFSGPPANRRRWLDDLTTALIPAHAGATARFAQHRQSRLKLLMNGQGGDWLDAEERLAAEWGIQVLKHRIEYLARLTPFLNSLTLALHGNALEVMTDENPVAALKGKFERSREIDARMGRTHAGPNTLELTGELTLESGQKIPLAQASSGQHKRGLIHWLVGHVQLLAQSQNRPPLVLVDEFSAHLDAQRRASLIETLTTAGCQVWLTDTETPSLNLPGLHVIHMENGKLHG